MNEMMQKPELESVLDEALSTFPDFTLPPGFTDNLVKKIEKQQTWKLLFVEFGLKTGVVAGVFIILFVALLYPLREGIPSIISTFATHWQKPASVIFILFFTFLFDQVLLKYLFYKKNS